MPLTAQIARLEAERLRPVPRADPLTDTFRQVIAVLYQAILADQAEGKWGSR